jgi:hypothetical protein
MADDERQAAELSKRTDDARQALLTFARTVGAVADNDADADLTNPASVVDLRHRISAHAAASLPSLVETVARAALDPALHRAADLYRDFTAFVVGARASAAAPAGRPDTPAVDQSGGAGSWARA